MAAASSFRLSLVIPAWNEAESIEQALQEATAALSRHLADYEIIVVDDGSTDQTAALVRAAAADNPHIRLVQQPQNLGYGAALRAGFRAATLPLVAFTDADCQFDLNDLAYMLPLTQRYDVTCGYRIDRQDPTRRRFFSWGYNTLVKTLLSSPVHDLDCALKIFHREQLLDFLPASNNFFVNTEMLTTARLQGRSIIEVGVTHRPRAAGESKVSLTDIPKTLGTLLPFWWSRLLFPASRVPTPLNARFWAGLLTLTLLALALLLPNLSYPLLEPDEGRYAEIAKEMLDRGDWVTPTLNGKVYYDKPPLYYWLTAASFWCGGVNEKMARLVPVLATLATLLAIYLFGWRHLGGRAAFLAGLVLALTPGFMQCGRLLILDSVLSLFVTLACLMALEATVGGRLNWWWWLASACACGLGVLTKGPVALVLVAPPMAAWAWLQTGVAPVRLRHWLVYLGVVLAVAAPWFVTIMLRDRSFAEIFFLEHHLDRFLNGRFHDKPIWYFLPVLFVSTLPWSLLVVPFARFYFTRSVQVGAQRTAAMGLCLLWAGWCLLFFTMSRGKLPPYILPALPALTLLVGGFLERLEFQHSLRFFFGAHRQRLWRRVLLVLAAVWFVAGGITWWAGLLPLPLELLLAMTCIACMMAAIVGGARLPTKFAWSACMVLAGLGFCTAAQCMLPAWSQQRSVRLFVTDGTALFNDPTVPVATYGQEWGSVPFYLPHHHVSNFANRDGEALKQFINAHPRTLLFVRHNIPLDHLRWAIPPAMTIRQVMPAGEAKVLVVERRDFTPPSSTAHEPDHARENDSADKLATDRHAPSSCPAATVIH